MKASQPEQSTEPVSSGYRYYALAVLFGVNFFSYMDRALVGVLTEPIKAEFSLSDTQMGALTLAFALVYAVLGLPIALLADRRKQYRVIVIAAAMTIWSAMTVASGLARNYAMLFAARLGVGFGEAGGNPPGQSLIGDYIPLSQRALAIAIYSSGAHVGIVVANAMGGYLGLEYGWRSVFMLLGIPGILFAALVALTLRNPPTRGVEEKPDSPLRQGSLWGALVHLFKGKSFSHLIIATGVLYFANQGASVWHVAFFMRSHGLDQAQGGYAVSILYFASFVGVLAGGFLADRFSKRDMIWLVRLPFIGTFLSLPMFWAMYLVPTPSLAIAGGVLAYLVSGLFGGVLLTAVQALVGPNARALAGAVLMLCTNLIGMGGAPFVVGILSDSLEPTFAEHSLRWALVIAKFVMLWAVLHLWLAIKPFKGELRETPA